MFKNSYIVRRVAEKDSRACFICYRPTTSVMVCETPNADFFYACPSHVSDPGFATISNNCKLALKERELKEKQIAELQREWEVAQKKKAEKSGKDESKAKDRQELSPLHERPKPVNIDSAPIKLVYELNKGIYNMRLQVKQKALHEKKTKAILSAPGAFPEVPVHKPR